MPQKQILIIDDEKSVRQSVAAAFQHEDIEVFSAGSGREALETLGQQSFDLIIVDVMLGDMDGFYIVNVIRRRGIHTPVLFLSGNTEEQSKIMGISMGGDDYLTKPFSLAMLTTKANALIRRSQEYNKDTNHSDLTCGPFHFVMKTYSLYKGERKIHLTSKETALMKFLMENQNQVFTKEQLYEHVWAQSIVDNNTIMVYIKRLRGKLEEDPKHPKYLRTAWGIGYILGNPEHS